MDVEKTLLEFDSKHKFEYSLDELLKSEKYLKELGEITDMYFSIQHEYRNTIDDNDPDLETKLRVYHARLTADEIDIDLSVYNDFITYLKTKITDGD